MDYKRVHNVSTVNTAKRRSPEERYWLSFKFQNIIKEYGPVNSLAFSSVEPHWFAVSASMRVQLYSIQTKQVVKAISSLKSIVKTSCFRQDGKLIATGDSDGNVSVFNVMTRTCLRTFKGHNQAVNCVRFTADKTRLVSISDDKTIRVWEVSSQEDKPLVFDDNTDYLKALAVSSSNPSKIAVGSYDHKVKIYDLDSQTVLMTIDFMDPVESLLFYPGDALLIVCGGPFVKIYDTFSGKCVAVLGNFEKTVTSICFDGKSSRLIAGSLDQNVKIYNTETFQLVASIKYQQPILSVAMSPDDSTLVVGMVNGLLSIKKRDLSKSSVLKNEIEAEEKAFRTGTLEYFKRTGTSQPDKDDHIVKDTRSRKLAKYDIFLKTFQYSKALDQAIQNKYKLQTSLSVIEELIARKGLRIAITGRDATSLNPIIEYVRKFIMKPEGSAILIELANEVLDAYSPYIADYPNLSELITVLQFKIKSELDLQNDLVMIKGCVDMIVATSEQKLL
ncbi:hypothetical protein BB561_000490 [Smittium simulii]|uniref:U3 small nucleolar RNA-associated protein 15 C-terminal domain-containing protein n=1 Tax=Smittium simulii TaxID=133385 RepID=A0A2T9YYV6_9FUNG|nr:hypothetical protein BB561_000490 [Smittium simulii]